MAFADSGNEPPSSAASGLDYRPVETIAITQGEAVRRITLLGQIEASEQQPYAPRRMA